MFCPCGPFLQVTGGVYLKLPIQGKHNVIGVQKVLVSFLYSVRSALVFQMINLSSYKRQITKIKYKDRI